MTNRCKGILTAILVVAAMVAGCDRHEKYLRVDPGSFEIASDVLEASAAIEASASWMSYCNADWLTCFMSADKSLYISISGANESPESRSTEITIITGDGQTKTIPFVQKAMDTVFDISPSAFPLFDSKGAVIQATVSANLEWTSGLLNDEPWVTVVRGEGGEDDILTISVARTDRLDERRDSLIVSPVNEEFLFLTDTIPVVQKGAELLVSSDLMKDSFTVEITAGTTEAVVYVIAKNNWTVETNDTEGRISLDMTGGGSDLDNGVALAITLPENTTAEPYTYTLTFSCNGEEFEYELVQSAPEEPEP